MADGRLAGAADGLDLSREAEPGVVPVQATVTAATAMSTSQRTILTVDGPRRSRAVELGALRPPVVVDMRFRRLIASPRLCLAAHPWADTKGG